MTGIYCNGRGERRLRLLIMCSDLSSHQERSKRYMVATSQSFPFTFTSSCCSSRWSVWPAGHLWRANVLHLTGLRSNVSVMFYGWNHQLYLFIRCYNISICVLDDEHLIYFLSLADFFNSVSADSVIFMLRVKMHAHSLVASAEGGP